MIQHGGVTTLQRIKYCSNTNIRFIHIVNQDKSKGHRVSLKLEPYTNSQDMIQAARNPIGTICKHVVLFASSEAGGANLMSLIAHYNTSNHTKPNFDILLTRTKQSWNARRKTPGATVLSALMELRMELVIMVSTVGHVVE